MSISPLLRETVEELRRQAGVRTILQVLEGRFGPVPPSDAAGLDEFMEEDDLRRLIPLLVLCPSLQSFQAGMRDDLLRSTPSKRRTKRAASRRRREEIVPKTPE